MTAANAPRLVLAALAAVALAVLAVTLPGGDDPYRFKLVLDNANGLRKGTSVRVGDIDAGKVRDVRLGNGDKVLVDVDLDPGEGPIGRDARVAVSSLNLLGQRFLSLDKGNVDRPAPSGVTLASSRVGESTDLDQVLNSLDSSTRARLGILLNEAGLALTGRKDDVRLLIGELPSTLPEITTLLERLTADNRSLGQVVDHGDRFIARLNSRRRDLLDLLDSARETSATFATKRRQLEATLAQAPGMLRTTQTLLADVRQTSAPLGPAARNLVKTAAPLESTLKSLKPFTKAVDPVLDEARDVSPSLTRLATGATPVIRSAATTAGKLDQFATSAKPATATLNDSVGNLIAILDNWSRALQYRDSLSHTFRGEPSITSNTVESLVDRLMGPPAKKRKKARPGPALRPPEAKDNAPLSGGAPRLPMPKLPGVPKLPDVPQVLDDTITAIQEGLLGGSPSKGSSDSSALLDFLLKP